MLQPEPSRGTLEIEVKERIQQDKEGGNANQRPARRRISRISGGWSGSDPLMEDHW
ncbi:MAG TPA: hypothetical protein VGE98_16275 [Thermoanaerobaculia bacterium]